MFSLFDVLFFAVAAGMGGYTVGRDVECNIWKRCGKFGMPRKIDFTTYRVIIDGE